MEIDVIRHQVVEAYEDYFAAVITAYFDWYEAYENLQIGESSYHENLKLMENIKERQKSSIALPIDLNKITLQVLAKKETLVELQEEHANALNFIEQTIRHDGRISLFRNLLMPIKTQIRILNRISNVSRTTAERTRSSICWRNGAHLTWLKGRTNCYRLLIWY